MTDDRQEAFSSDLEAVETSLGEVGGRVEALENISDQIQTKLAAEIEKLDKVDADFSSQLSDFQQETRTNLDNLRAMEVRTEIFLGKQNIQNIFRTPSIAG